MECDFTEKVSMLMDGELPQEEIEQVSMHIDTCSICRQARQDFLDMRQQIRSYESRRDQAAEARALRRIIGAEQLPFWKRRVPVPAPAFALLVLALIALAAWTVVAGPGGAEQPFDPTGAERGQPSMASYPGAIDFSRYDHGDRAIIYKTRRSR